MPFLFSRNIKKPSAQAWYAVNQNGQVYTWGLNTQGTLGDNTSNTASAAVATVVGGRLFSKVAQLRKTSNAPVTFGGLELFTGNAYTWGQNNYGQLGNNTTARSSSPVSVLGGRVFRDLVVDAVNSSSPNFIGIEASTGNLWAWGYGLYGNLGNGTTTSVSSPVSVLGGRSYSQVLINSLTCVGREASTGRIYAWGYNGSGQLGNNSTADASSPVSVLGGRSYSGFSLGSDTVAAIEGSTGNVYVWGGANNYGQLGNNTTNKSSSPVSVFGGRSFSQISVEITGRCIFGIEGSTGKAYSWGYGNGAQLGDGTANSASSPVAVLGGRSYASIESGGVFSAAIEGSTGQIYAWGANSFAQLGTGDTINYSSPVSVYGGKSFSYIFLGDNSSLAVEGSTGQMYAWGQNGSNLTIPSPLVHNIGSPISLYGTNRSFKGIAGDAYGGVAFGVALENSTGLAYAWGTNAQGQLGNNSTDLSLTPASVLGQRSYSAIYPVALPLGGNPGTTFAIEGSTGNIYAWGYNASGLLGTNSTDSKSSPVVVVGGRSYKDIFISSASNAVALDGSGNIYGWGSNSSAYIGDGSTVNRSSPVQVIPGIPKSFSQASQYFDVGVGIDNSGAVFSWGALPGDLTDGIYYHAKSQPYLSGSFSQIISSGSEVYTLNGNGNAYSWGDNIYGQLGLNTFTLGTNSLFPLSISSSKSFKDVFPADTYCLAIDSAGSISAWGKNLYGQLGDGTTTNSSTPISVSSALSFSKIAVNWYEEASLALEGSTGRAYAWGWNWAGQLGNNTTNSSSLPVSVLGGRSFKEIYLSSLGTVFGIEGSTGNLYGWGFNQYGILGNGGTARASSPISVLGGRSFSQIAITEERAIAIEAGTGRLWSWGENSSGTLGNNTTADSSSPVSVVGGRSFSKIAHSLGYFCIGIEGSTGNAYSWGLNNYGQLGNNDGGGGAATLRSSPVSVVGGRSWSQIMAGYQSAVAIEGSTGNIYTWGENSYGQLGNNSRSPASSPVAIAVVRSFKQIVTQINNSSWNCFALEASTGIVWGWGNNDSACITGRWSQLSSVPISSPVAISTISFSKIAYEGQRAYGIEGSTGKIWGWGSNNLSGVARLGVAPILNNASSPVSVVGAKSFKQIAVDLNGHTAVAVDNNGYLWSWGDNSYGQLGNNSIALGASSPVSVLGGRSYSQILIHSGVAHGIEGSTGRIYSWGYNGNGRVGNNSITDQSSPISLLGGRSFRQIVATSLMTAALEGSTGNVYAWGDNAAGQLGIGTTVNASSPVSVLGGRSFSLLTVASTGPAAIEGSTGAVYTWGYNTLGQLGIGSVASASSPVSVLGGRSFSKIAGDVSAYSFVAIEGSTGNAFSWGYNNNGQLGIGSVANASSPISVIGGRSFQSVSMVGGAATAKDGSGVLYSWGAQKGTGLLNNTSTPQAVVALSPISMSQAVVDTSGNYLARDFSGNLYAWGPNAQAQTGNSTVGATVVPRSVIGGRSFAQVAAGNQCFYGIDGSTGYAYAWGSNASGQLGTGTGGGTVSSPISVFMPASLTAKSFSQASVGLGIEGSTGKIFSWGSNASGQLGNNSTTGVQAGITSVATSRSFSQIHADLSFSNYLGLEGSTGNAYAWGDNTFGQLGNNTASSASSPVSVLGGRSFRQIISTGTVIALEASTGNAYTWGRNTSGQLGNNSAASASSPVSVLGGRSFRSIASSGISNFGLEGSTGNLYSWGSNISGVLGTNVASTASSPVSVVGGRSYSQVFVSLNQGSGLVAAIEGSTGNAYAWGIGTSGQLGRASVVNASSPVSVLGGRSFSQIRVSLDNTLIAAIEGSTGNAYTWGLGTSGQLGNGSAASASSPVSVLGGRSYSRVILGTTAVAAIEGSTGNIYAWGVGSSGQLGTNSTANASSPVSVLGGRSFTNLNSTTNLFSAIEGSTGNVYSWGVYSNNTLGTYSIVSVSSPVAVVYPQGTRSFRQIVSETSGSAIAIEASTGNLYGWGANGNGQLGLGTVAAQALGTSVLGARSFSQVIVSKASGRQGFLAIEGSTGRAYAWGLGNSGTLGNNALPNASSPVSVLGGRSWSQIVEVSGSVFATEGSTGQVFVWGQNAYGQLGINAMAGVAMTPISISGIPNFNRGS